MKRDDIIKAGLDEFSRHSYTEASTNEIIKRSNTSKGTFYHYFGSKEALYLALVQTVVDQKTTFLTADMQADDSAAEHSSIFDVLRMQIVSAVRFAIHHPEYARFSERIAIEQDEAIKEKVQRVVGKAADTYYDELIATSMEQKQLREDLPGDFIRQIIIFMLTHFNDFVKSSGIELSVNNADNIQKVLQRYIDFIENGLAYK